MPQGKGTYGSQVGRPSKKKYDKGGNVDPFSLRNSEGVAREQAMEVIDAKNMKEQLSEAMENQNMANKGIPTANAQERSQVSPDVEQYKDGGKVRDTSKKALQKYYKEHVDRAVEGTLKGKEKPMTKHVDPMTGETRGKGRSYNITDVVKTVGREKKLKEGYKKYWDKENKGKKK